MNGIVWSGASPLRRFVAALAGAASVACLTLALWFHLQAGYEDDVFARIAAEALRSRPPSVEPVVQLTHSAHALVAPRFSVFDKSPYANLADSLLRMPLNDLIDGRGACGSFTTVLARLLQVSGYEFRTVQMHCVRQRGCHMLVEAKQDGAWVVLDAMYDMAFRRRDGRLASIADVGRDWAYYQGQAPASMPVNEYTFQQYDYTNWEKIPYLMPAIKGILGWLIGEHIETLSLRSYVIDRGRVVSYIWFVLGAVLGALGWVAGRPTRHVQDRGLWSA